MSAGARVGAVLIGRNEGARLIACLDSVVGRLDRVVYVDSGSTDGSVAAARARGAEVVILDADVPFTAARARNAGAAALAAGDPEGRIASVQFVDGDCALDPDWIAAAQAVLAAQPKTAVVCGRRRERFPDASIYNRLCDMEWNTPVGEAAACGGDALMRRDAFEAAGGFDPTLIAGEEPELCLRLRRAGWTIRRIDAEMTLHDAAMTRLGQWRRRAERGGWAYAEGAARHGDGPERYNRRAARGVRLWGVWVPAAVAGLSASAAVLAAADGPWAAALLAAAAVAALYPLQALRVALGRRRRFGDPWRHAALYGAFVMLGKIPQAIGAARYAQARRAGAQGALIEYK